MKTARKLFAAVFFSLALATTAGCSIVKEYIPPEISQIVGVKQVKQLVEKKAEKKAGKKTKKKAEEEDEGGITVYKIGGYAIKAALAYALIIGLGS